MRPQKLKLRRWYGARGRSVSALFDTGSEDGLIRKSVASRLARHALPDLLVFGGIGGGGVRVSEASEFLVQVLGKWCRYSAFVVGDDALDVDLLIGEDFLLRYGLRVNPRRNRVEVESRLQFERMTKRRIFVASARGPIRGKDSPHRR